MNYGLVRSIAVMTALTGSAQLLASGIINTYIYDIFEKCFTREYGGDSNICQSGLNVSIYLLATVFFFLGLLAFTYVKKMKIGSYLKVAGYAFVYFWLLVGLWKLVGELSNNFQIPSTVGPKGPNQYAFLLLLRLDFVVAGVILGVGWWLPGAISKNAIDSKDRNAEPRVNFVKSKKK